MSPLSSDLLHQVFVFFVSKTKIIDGESLRSASLVCKQWREAVNSKSLWAIPTCADDDVGDVAKKLNTQQSSFQIREANYIDSGGSPEESLMGFTKLRFLGKDLGFLVRERATQLDWLICIANDGHKSPRLIRQLYADHFELNEKFFDLEDASPSDLLSNQPYPSGICIWKGRIIRWYRPSALGGLCHGMEGDWSALEAARLRHFCLPPRDPLHQSPDWAKMFDQAAVVLSRQLDLERCCASNPRKRIVPLDVWATIADWVVEVAECFNLEDRTIFQAMALVDRFLGSIEQEVNPRHYQLVAGSSLLLASKCNKMFLTCKDICYCSDNSFSPDQVEATEELILQHLEWKLAFPTSMDFLLSYARIMNIDENGRFFVMCSYVNELSLQTDSYFCYPPSVLGASSMVLGRYCLQDFSPGGSSLWPKELVEASALTLDAIMACTIQLSRDLADLRITMPDLTMIRRRHSKSSRHCVAEVDIHALPSSRVIAAFEERLRSQL